MSYPTSTYSSRQTAFDGPGARTILGGDAGLSTSADTSSHHAHQQRVGEMEPKSPTPASEPGDGTSPNQDAASLAKRVGGKPNVSSACGPCKRAHLACDIARPCKRCVNMGKPEQCEDVPHKKRGRPKVPKPALGEPYHRAKPPPPSESSGVGKWKGPSAYDAPYMTTVDAPPPPTALPISRNAPSTSRPGQGLEGDQTYPSAVPPTQPFTLFTTTDFKILRASPTCYPLIGYHPNEFVNLNLLDWIHPQDRHFIDIERNRLLTVPYVDAPLRSTDVTQAAITQRSELELLSPAEGMREPYPNKNVRVLHSDNRFSPFNIRLHLGGGLGASLWQPASLGRIYLVISFLAIPAARPSRDMPPDIPQPLPSRRSSQIAPPTPITPAQSMPGHGLPGFSAIAAAADAPLPRYENLPPQPYYPPQPASVPRPSGPSLSAYPYPRPGPPPNVPAIYGSGGPRRSSSPSAAYRTPQSSTYPVGTPDYSHAPQPPPAGAAGYYPPEAYRRPSEDDKWRNGNNGNGRAIPPPGGPGAMPPPSGDGARRAWEL
ncbi:hypothetical protein IAR55_003908 [Kwoniella newhampshirensis]|uniref:Transcription activator of gluconeogenesis ERT1 n=1 Tax=Kwoniella newhampshirensis TaxID=1651941 RepID=A0AAW0YQJ2_9TREE